MTIPVFRAKNALNYASRPSPMVVTKPAGTVANDILVAVAVMGITTGDPTSIFPPDGTWTAIRAKTRATDAGGFNVDLFGWWKRAGGSEGASYSFTQDAGANRTTEIAIAAYSGCITTGSPIDAVSANSGTTGTQATALSVTTTVADALLVIFDHSWDAAGHAAPSGFTERHEFQTTINDAGQASAGASGNKGPYAVGNVSSNPWQSWMFALKPASTGKVKVWDGSAWNEKPAKVWSGSAWVAKPVKVWTGAAWVLA